MKNKINKLILNGNDIGISKIELNRDNLLITDKSCKYCLSINLHYNWKDINRIKVGEKKTSISNEYCLSENNEPALIWPSSCYVEKVNDNTICFFLEFNKSDDNITYMNKRGFFDIEINYLKVKVYINYEDAKGNSIVYTYDD